MPVMRPWATMPKIAALMPKSVSVAMPSITKPMCATDENAISRFMSRLRETAQRAVDDADHREQADPRRPGLRGLGQDRERDADEAVGAELQQDRGQEHRADGRRLGVRVGQPRVEREHRHLDREAEEQPGEDQHLGAVRDAGAARAA